MVSKRLQEIPASGTIAISNLVSQMKAEGVDIVSFSMGEPDFTTPENVIDACCDSLHRGFTHYTPSTGIPELRQAVADMEREKDGVPCKASNVLITPTKQAIFMIALAYIDPGDEVILSDPSWVSYEACIRLAGGVPVYVPTRYEDEFVLDPAAVEAAVTPRTKMIILNTPSNPTGTVIPENVLREIARIAEEHDLLVMSDEIYESIIYEGKHTSFASLPGMFDRTITVSGLSEENILPGKDYTYEVWMWVNNTTLLNDGTGGYGPLFDVTKYAEWVNPTNPEDPYSDDDSGCDITSLIAPDKVWSPAGYVVRYNVYRGLSGHVDKETGYGDTPYIKVSIHVQRDATAAEDTNVGIYPTLGAQ